MIYTASACEQHKKQSFTHVYGSMFFCSPITGKHKTNHFSLNSQNRQALTGTDQCSDGGMWMSHVFSIIYTALLFLSPPLRQLSILLHRNQSVICQTLSIQAWFMSAIVADYMPVWLEGGKGQMEERGILKEILNLREINHTRLRFNLQT